MGKSDVVLKQWLKKKIRFADLFNAVVFDGEQVIKPEELEEISSESGIVIANADNDEKDTTGKAGKVRYRTEQRYRDLVMSWKGEAELAKKIAQRDYDMRIVRSASMRMKAIDAFLDCYGATGLGEIYETTNPGRRELLSAKILSDEEYKRQWQEVEYKGKAFEDGQKVILTERGERVRSKSEKIIADKLYSMGIPYRYECPLWLDGNVRFYPDFTVLRMPAREEVYFEHFGMMDDIGYVEGMTYKLSTYEKNGIYLGVNLFVTYETEKTALNSKVLDGLIRSVFL